MSLFKSYFGQPKFLLQGVLGYLAYVWIFPPSFAARIHKMRGVKIDDARTVYIAPNVIIDTSFPGHVTIGNGAYITRGAKILCHTAYTPMTQEFTGVDCVVGDVVIGAGAYIGVNAIVLPNTRVGRCAIIGAGAVVTKDVPDYAIAVGVPARVVGDVRKLSDRRSQNLMTKLDRCS